MALEEASIVDDLLLDAGDGAGPNVARLRRCHGRGHPGRWRWGRRTPEDDIVGRWTGDFHGRPAHVVNLEVIGMDSSAQNDRVRRVSQARSGQVRPELKESRTRADRALSYQARFVVEVAIKL